MLTDQATIRQVIRWLGWMTLFALIGTIWLISRLIQQASGKGNVDPGSVALIIPVSNFAVAGLTAIGTLLTSTRSNNQPTEVEVTNDNKNPVPVDDAGQVVSGNAVLILLVLILVVVLLIWFGVGSP